MGEMDTTEDEWPTLNTNVSTETDDWELIASDEPESSSSQQPVMVEMPRRPRSLSSSFSTPDLSRYDILESVPEEDNHSCSKCHDDDSSYDVVAGPRSVWSVASRLSFRDVILQKAASSDTKRSHPTIEQEQLQPTLRPFRLKPKFVVKPIHRCAKSTGDLLSLKKIEEDDDDDDDDIIGETDAMEFYHRKSSGARSRYNGAKIRPDEAKRLQITMHKKHLQRNNGSS
ncbi:hypothetical protein FisN_25Lh097 [Fistulifera solaris]|uniref:Uncharacterized protein n=1 Tax=Fistulifera solaris TaxID=1519565 RepID=A0A1Z5J814_FISSO|nr:hypothetical protein FisN_25Lh097 [Fistulifera solaris]|eukprot:GAX10052.1 hypothetical protein FisN_25Lh097 [Fistulifera solaris]